MCICYDKYSGKRGTYTPFEPPVKEQRTAVARPKKSPDELRDTYVQVRLTVRERAQLEQRAAAYGLTLSEYMRRTGNGRPLPAGVAEQHSRAVLATALLRLGVNLNQIARHMNAGRFAPSYLPHLIEDIRGHVERLSRDEPGRDRRG